MRGEVIIKKIREDIAQKGAPDWVIDNLQYLTQMGSRAYATNHADSDWDVYGFTVPPEEVLVPFSEGEFCYVDGYDSIKPQGRFEQQQGKIVAAKSSEEIEYQIYSISKYFKLVEENNPNMIDSLFTREHCVMYSTEIGDLVRKNRKLFLHKGCWHKFRGYAHSELRKANRPTDKRQSEHRKELISKYGYDTKFAVHLYRLLDEVEQLLTTGDVDLMRNREQHKQVLNGFYTYAEVEQFFKDREKHLFEAYEKSELPYGPDSVTIRAFLVRLLASFYNQK